MLFWSWMGNEARESDDGILGCILGCVELIFGGYRKGCQRIDDIEGQTVLGRKSDEFEVDM